MEPSEKIDNEKIDNNVNFVRVPLGTYDAFHSMTCNVLNATICSLSLKGKVLFMPEKCEPNDYKRYTYLGSLDGLSVIRYYLLVILSFTGLSTLLGMTKTKRSEESLVVGFACNEITPAVLQHLGIESENGLVIRRFEYDFGLPMLKVKMFHVLDKATDKLHLVEIYERRNFLLQLYFGLAMVSERSERALLKYAKGRVIYGYIHY